MQSRIDAIEARLKALEERVLDGCGYGPLPEVETLKNELARRKERSARRDAHFAELHAKARTLENELAVVRAAADQNEARVKLVLDERDEAIKERNAYRGDAEVALGRQHEAERERDAALGECARLRATLALHQIWEV